MTIYNKLIRDKIPEIIHKTGNEFTTRILSDEECRFELRNKLGEELTEYSDQPRS